MLTKIKFFRHLGALMVSVAALTSHASWGSVIITGTRVIYPADARDVNVRLTNNGPTPALVQIWIDKGDPNASPEQVKVPFVLTPPIARIDPNKSQIVRLVYTGEVQSAEKESLYWLNMVEIPPKPVEGANYLQFAVRTRIKVFYRPAQLKSGPIDAGPRLEWSLQKDGKKLTLQAINPSPYFVSLSQVRLVTKDGKESGKPMNVMLAPGATERIPFEDVNDSELLLSAVRYQLIDDYGAFIESEKHLEGVPN